MSIPCIVCGDDIVVSYPSDELNEVTEDNIDTNSFANGMAGTMAYGYGCELDGNIYMIGICRDCTLRKHARGKLILVRNYIEDIISKPNTRMIDEDLLALPEPISNEKKYENVIALLKLHVEYYASHTDITCINEDGSENIWPRATATGSVEALKEVLDHFEEEYLGHKAGCCNPEEGCTCGFVKQNEI